MTHEATAGPPLDDLDLPSCHHLRFHAGGPAHAEAILDHLAPALAPGHAAIAVVTHERLEELRRCATLRGIDLDNAMDESAFVHVDAGAWAERLAAPDRLPTQAAFVSAIGRLLLETSITRPRLRIHGELVGLLWEQGHRSTAFWVERLWNQFARVQPFHLQCAYPAGAFHPVEDAAALADLCALHPGPVHGAPA